MIGGFVALAALMVGLFRWRATVEDPRSYTAPWTIELPLARDPSYDLYEYACHEGNYAVPNILRGARVEDRAAAASR